MQLNDIRHSASATATKNNKSERRD
jgi:hypothetical protein